MSLEKKGCSRLSCSLFLPTNNAEEETRLLPLGSHLGQRENEHNQEFHQLLRGTRCQRQGQGQTAPNTLSIGFPSDVAS